jgi:hypothetical protein
VALTGFVPTVTVVLMALVPVLITETVFEPAETEFVAALATYALVPSGVNRHRSGYPRLSPSRLSFLTGYCCLLTVNSLPPPERLLGIFPINFSASIGSAI